MRIMLYIVSASCCLTLFYIAFRLIFNSDRNFFQARMFLLTSIAISLIIPFSNYRINTLSLQKVKNFSPVTIENTGDQGQPAFLITEQEILGTWDKIRARKDMLYKAGIALYAFIALILLARIILQILILYMQYNISLKVHRQGCVLLYNHRFRNTFSFFRWIFVYEDPDAHDETEHILTHEKIHASQHHSVDLIVIELLAAAMWFNPLIWMMKRSMLLVHEYLADEGALNTGIDRLRYQALLINQVTEERLVSLSSCFNPVRRPGGHSLIKKRMIMMTTSKIKQRTKHKLLALLPLSISVLFVSAIFNGIFSEKIQGARSLKTPPLLDGNEILASNFIDPPDTIVKKTIIKKVYKDNPQDTIVEENEEIIVLNDSVKHHEMIRHDLNDNEGKVIIHSEEDKNMILHEMHGDSVTIVKVIKHNGDANDEEVILHSNKITLRHTGDSQSSKILFVIDGVSHPEKKGLEAVDPDQIDRIEIIKGDGIKLFTTENYDGVIIITTKTAKKK